LDNIVIFTLTVIGLSYIINKSYLFEKVRNFKKIKIVNKLLNCSMCSSFWIGLFIHFIIPVSYIIIDPIIAVGIIYIFENLIKW
jgi:hypothetical protein